MKVKCLTMVEWAKNDCVTRCLLPRTFYAAEYEIPLAVFIEIIRNTQSVLYFLSLEYGFPLGVTEYMCVRIFTLLFARWCYSSMLLLALLLLLLLLHVWQSARDTNERTNELCARRENRMEKPTTTATTTTSTNKNRENTSRRQN